MRAKKADLEKEVIGLRQAVTKQNEIMQGYLNLLQHKFELRVPAQLIIGDRIFNVVLVDKDNVPIKQKADVRVEQKNEQKTEELYKTLNLSYIG